jgi:thioesterase DpgC
MYERRIDCDSDVGRMICDEVVGPRDRRHDRSGDRPLTGSGAVGAIGNRRRCASSPSRSTRSASTPRSMPASRRVPFQPGADLQSRAFLEAQSRKA